MKTKLLLGMAVILVTLLACGGTDSNTGTSTTKSDAEAKSDQATTAPATQKHFKIGETVKVGDGWQVIVNSVKTSPGSEFFKPKDGNVYLVISVTTKNISKEEQNLSSMLSFTLKDKEGQKYNSTITDSNQSTLDGKVPAGDQLKGNLSYEVPTDQKVFTLAFEAEIFAKGQTIWDLSV